VNAVVCTHLHGDHVGRNTMWKHGRWVPTFPNARYLIGRQESPTGRPIAIRSPGRSWPTRCS
jgi:glyoxylase-like metal-dependent hydrolase (beta-lactamase superfamily II)